MNDICSDEELKEIAEQWCDLVGEEFTASTLNAFIMGAKLAIANNGWTNLNKGYDALEEINKLLE